MSSTTTPSASDGGASVASPPPNHNYLANIGLGYIIAITLGFLVLLSTVLLASYVCCGTGGRQRHRHNRSHNARSSSDGIAVPRVFFVAESEEGGGGGDDDQEAAAVGLDAAVINSYPKFSFSRSSDLGTSNNLCSICLCEYKDSEMLRMMPDCRHFFHLFCLDAWLRLNGSCPVCRNSPLPTPLSTPLSEVVPLSQYQR